ncbi:hypothetical protein, partial [Treponema sp.]|uniref:hypothetical protein n=1 Tax=Treponema sp. TaxID=166 RepID=UPI003F061242
MTKIKRNDIFLFTYDIRLLFDSLREGKKKRQQRRLFLFGKSLGAGERRGRLYRRRKSSVCPVEQRKSP